MKKLISGLTAIVIVSTGIFAFAGCEKEEESKTDNIKNVQKTACTEVTDPEEDEPTDRAYSIATFDGEQFHLTFDPELFLHNLEDYLNSHSGEQYAAEDVSIYPDPVDDVPFLCISLYNITNLTADRIYLLLSSECEDPNSAWGFTENTVLTLTCSTTARCHSKRKTGCHEEKAPDGYRRCSPCITPGVDCNQSTTSAIYMNAIYMALK